MKIEKCVIWCFITLCLMQEQDIVMSLSVVYLSLHSHISRVQEMFCARYLWPRFCPHTQRRCDTLCTSVFWMMSYLFIMGSMTQVRHTCKLKVTQRVQHKFDTAGSQCILNMTHQRRAPDRGRSLMSTVALCSS